MSSMQFDIDRTQWTGSGEISQQLMAKARLKVERTIDLKYATSREEAEHWRDRGYEPVECSFGRESVVGPLKLDHHGSLSAEEPVSIKAARLAQQGERINKFVGAGMADSDATYAMLVLSGLVTPSIEIASGLAELDLDPVGLDRTREPYIREVALEMNGIPSLDLEGFIGALAAGYFAFDATPLSAAARERCIEYERDRIQRGEQAIKVIDGETAFVEFNGPSRDVWHRRASIVVQFKPAQEVLTVCGCSREAAARLQRKSVYDIFGAEGLLNLYPALDSILGPGCGGRQDIGGSPRGSKVTREQAVKVFNFVREQVRALLAG